MSSRRVSSNRSTRSGARSRALLVRLGRQVDAPATKVSGAHLEADLVRDRPGRDARDPLFTGAGCPTGARGCTCMRACPTTAGAPHARCAAGSRSRAASVSDVRRLLLQSRLNEHVPGLPAAVSESYRTSCSIRRERQRRAQGRHHHHHHGRVQNIRPATTGSASRLSRSRSPGRLA